MSVSGLGERSEASPPRPQPPPRCPSRARLPAGSFSSSTGHCTPILTWIAGSIDSLERKRERQPRVARTGAARRVSPKDDDDRAFGVGDDAESLPHHQRGRDDRRELERLVEVLHRRARQRRGAGRGTRRAGEKLTCRTPSRWKSAISWANMVLRVACARRTVGWMQEAEGRSRRDCHPSSVRSRSNMTGKVLWERSVFTAAYGIHKIR